MTSFTRAELRTLFMDQRDRIFRLLYRLTGNAQDAEDLLQETFLAVWRKRHQFEGRGAPEGYVRRTAVRLFLNTKQRQVRRPAMGSGLDAPGMALEAEVATPAEHLERRDATEFLVDRVNEALHALPDAAREAFVLFRFEGFTCAEIAELTEAPVKTIETRLRRATQVLAERLERYRNLLPAI